MANVNVKWVLPDTRESTKPLAIGDIDYVEIFISADNGVNFGSFGRYEPNILETTVTDLEPGMWFFGGIVTDIRGSSGKMLKASINIPDNTPPGTLLSLTLSL